VAREVAVETDKRREENHPPLRIEPPLYRRRVDFFTKSRAFDITLRGAPPA
jgi:hypothetical protein